MFVSCEQVWVVATRACFHGARLLLLLVILSASVVALYAAESLPSVVGNLSANALFEDEDQSESHRIISGDRLDVRVLQDADLDRIVMVDLQGRIQLSLIGGVKVAGLSVESATKKIRDAYQVDYIIDPTVSLSIVEYGKKRFTVIGAVKRPGDYLIRANQSINILQAIAIAGGYSAQADSRKITVKRTVAGKEIVQKVNGRNMAKESDVAVFKVFSNDIISVGQSLF